MNSKRLKDAIDAIMKVTSDLKYFENSEKVTKLFRDKPEKPLDILRSPTIELGFFASNSYDIYDVILTVIVFIHLMIYAFMMRLVKKLFKTKIKKEKWFILNELAWELNDLRKFFRGRTNSINKCMVTIYFRFFTFTWAIEFFMNLCLTIINNDG